MGDSMLRVSDETKLRLELEKRTGESFDDLLRRLASRDHWTGFGLLAADEHDAQEGLQRVREETRDGMTLELDDASWVPDDWPDWDEVLDLDDLLDWFDSDDEERPITTLCLDGALLADYLAGRPAARAFLARYDHLPWCVSGLVLSEVLLVVTNGAGEGDAAAAGDVAAVDGNVSGVDGDVEAVRQAIASSMDVLAVTERTAVEAAAIRRELAERGAELGHRELLLAANAREHGATLATAADGFRDDEVREVVDVVVYRPRRTHHS